MNNLSLWANTVVWIKAKHQNLHNSSNRAQYTSNSSTLWLGVASFVNFFFFLLSFFTFSLLILSYVPVTFSFLLLVVVFIKFFIREWRIWVSSLPVSVCPGWFSSRPFSAIGCHASSRKTPGPRPNNNIFGVKRKKKKGLAIPIEDFNGFFFFLFLRLGRLKEANKKAKKFPFFFFYLIHMFSGFRRSLDVGHSPLLGAVLSFFQRHFPPLTKVAFISDQQKWDVFVIFNS